MEGAIKISYDLSEGELGLLINRLGLALTQEEIKSLKSMVDIFREQNQVLKDLDLDDEDMIATIT